MDEYAQIRNVGPSELFELIPDHQRAMDRNKALLSYMEAMASEHNFFKDKLRSLPLLLNPRRSGEFSPEDLGESTEEFDAWIELTKKGQTSSSYFRQLESRLPASIAAYYNQQRILSYLGQAVGHRTYSRHEIAATRVLIATSVFRNAIKATPASFYVIGRILGFVDIKIRELWTRFSLTEPQFPNSSRNELDFSPIPEQYPYRPERDGRIYVPEFASDRDYQRYGVGIVTGPGPFQFPLPDPTYDPFNLQDGGEKEIKFFGLGISNLMPDFYGRVINGRNPWGELLSTPVGVRFKPGKYQMTGGSDRTRARAKIGLVGGGELIFEALTKGSHYNLTTIEVIPRPSNKFDFILRGVQSKVKFKSSLFDVIAAVEPSTFVSLTPPLEVEPNPSGSYSDVFSVRPPSVIRIVSAEVINADRLSLSFEGGLPDIPIGTVVQVDGLTNGSGLRIVQGTAGDRLILSSGDFDAPIRNEFVGFTTTPTLSVGRKAGELPLTGTKEGNLRQTLPEGIDWQLDTNKFSELVATLKSMVEDNRPLTRQVRRYVSGLLLNDVFNYAPVFLNSRVILQSGDGQKWELSSTGSTPSFFLAEDQGLPAMDVVQSDRRLGVYIRWSVNNQGSFVPTQTTDERNDSVRIDSRWIAIDNGRLVYREGVPEGTLEFLYSDNTLDESLLLQQKQFVVENPPEQVIPYLSEDAVSDDAPIDEFAFTRPQDTVLPRVLLIDSSNGHLEPGFGRSIDAFDDPFSVFSYSLHPRYEGANIRNRATGLDANIGDLPQRSPIMNDPIQWKNHRFTLGYRDRSNNNPIVASYSNEATVDSEGGAIVKFDMNWADGQTEGDSTLSQSGLLVTPNDQSPTEVLPWESSVTRSFLFPPIDSSKPHYEYTAPDWALLFWGDIDTSMLAVGQEVTLVGPSGSLPARVIGYQLGTISGDTVLRVELDMTYNEFTSIGGDTEVSVRWRIVSSQSWRDSFTSNLRLGSGGPISVFVGDDNGDRVTRSLSSGNSSIDTINNASGIAYVEVTGGEGQIEWSRPGTPTFYDELPPQPLVFSNVRIVHAGPGLVDTGFLNFESSPILSGGRHLYQGASGLWTWDVSYNPSTDKFEKLTLIWDNSLSINLYSGVGGGQCEEFIKSYPSSILVYSGGEGLGEVRTSCGMIHFKKKPTLLWGGGSRDAVSVTLS